jgi:tetratricopeptide (TPR) repeat protein
VRKRPAELSAWDLLQRGCWHCHRFTEGDMVRARAYMEQSLEIDPLSGPAHAHIAETHMYGVIMGWSDDMYGVIMGWSDDPARSIADGMAAAQRATALDPNEALSRSVLSTLNVLNHQPERGAEEAARAIALNPSYAIGHLALGYSLVFAGRPGEGIEAITRALRLSPRDLEVTVFWAQLALAHLVLKDFEAAADCARKALAENPANSRAGHRLASALAHKGDIAGAKAAFAETKRHFPAPTRTYFEATYAFADPDIESPRGLLPRLRCRTCMAMNPPIYALPSLSTDQRTYLSHTPNKTAITIRKKWSIIMVCVYYGFTSD